LRASFGAAASTAPGLIGRGAGLQILSFDANAVASHFRVGRTLSASHRSAQSQGRVDEPITFLGIDSDAGPPAKPSILRQQLDPDGWLVRIDWSDTAQEKRREAHQSWIVARRVAVRCGWVSAMDETSASSIRDEVCKPKQNQVSYLTRAPNGWPHKEQGVSWLLIPDCSHVTHLERPEVLSPTLKAFLRSKDIGFLAPQ